MLKNTFKDSISHQNSYQVNTYFSGEEIFELATLKKFSLLSWKPAILTVILKY